MPLDPNTPSLIFIRALQGQNPTPGQLECLDEGWQELVEAALEATPVNRRATLILAKAGQSSITRLLETLRGQSPSDQRPWPDPTPFDGPVLPPFPSQVLPDWLASFVCAEARATQTPPDLAGLLSLAVLASTLSGRVVLNPWGDWIEPLNLFTIVVLPPGHRKSAVFNSVTEPLRQFEADAAISATPTIALARRRQYAAEVALHRAQDAAALAPEDRRPELIAIVERRLEELAAVELPHVPRLITDDCSPERLAMLLAEQGGRLAILSPEGGIFDLIAGRYSSTGAPNLDHYLKGHAGDPIVVDRVGRPGEIIPRPALTIGLAVQPEVLRSLLARPGFHGRGLLARFLYAVPNAILGTRAVDAEPVPAAIRSEYHRRILAFLHLTHPHLPASIEHPDAAPTDCRQHAMSSRAERACPTPLSSRAEPACPSPMSSRAERACERSRGISRSHAPQPGDPPGPALREHDPRPPFGVAASRLPHASSPLVLPFDRFAAERLRQFAREIEPRLAPDADLDPIVDWASKLVGATARIAGLLHLASLDLPQNPTPITQNPVDSAVAIADYLIEHAKAAYAAMGIDPAVASIPFLLAWLRRTGLTSFTRRDAHRAAGPRIRAAADLDDALDQLEQHAYIRLRPAADRSGPGRRPSPTYDVHPSLRPG